MSGWVYVREWRGRGDYFSLPVSSITATRVFAQGLNEDGSSGAVYQVLVRSGGDWYFASQHEDEAAAEAEAEWFSERLAPPATVLAAITEVCRNTSADAATIRQFIPLLDAIAALAGVEEEASYDIAHLRWSAGVGPHPGYR